jgi:hypothetical protein
MKRLWMARPIACALLLAAAFAAARPAAAADPGPWKFGTTAQLTLSQSAFSSNWAGGDRGSLVWVIGTDTQADRQLTTRFNWANHLELAYGQTSKQNPDPSNGGDLRWDTPEKSTDKIALESTGRWTLDRWADPYFSLRLDSQFLDQGNPLGELSFNPIKLKEAAGIARVLRKTDDASVLTRLGFGFRQTMGKTFVIDPALRKASFSSNDGGLEWQTNVVQPMLEKKVLYKGQLLLFQPVFYSKSSALEQFDRDVRAGDASRAAEPGREPVADFWKAVDVNFQNEFTASITKVLGVSLTAQFVYDKFDAAANVDNTLPLAALEPEILRNTRKAGQFREVLALTIKYALF